jgi:hypothetical protein
VLADSAQAGWEWLEQLGVNRRRRRRARPVASDTEPELDRRERRQPEPEPEASEPEPEARRRRRPEPEPRPEPQPSPLPRALTAAAPGRASNDCQPCRKRRRPPRPSDKVPTVRSYKRRMSVYSLENLNRGPSRKGS